MCTEPQVLEIMLVVKKGLDIIKIAAPILAVVIIGIDVIRSVTSGGEQIAKTLKIIPKRLLLLAVIFLIPFAVELMMNVIAPEVEFAACFENATAENIEIAYREKAENLVARAEISESRTDYDAALVAVRKLDDPDLQGQLNARLTVVLSQVVAKENASMKPGGETSTPGGNSAPSTPGSSGKRLAVAYSQLASGGYGNLPFCTSGNNIAACGCGATSLAMVASGLGSSSYTPKVVAEYMCSQGHSGCGVAESEWLSSSSVGSSTLNHFGLSSSMLFQNVTGQNTSGEVMQAKTAIVNSLKAGKPIILHIPGHYVVLAEITSDNRVYLINPADVRSFNLATGYYTLDSLWTKTYNYRGRCNQGRSCGWLSATAFSKK